MDTLSTASSKDIALEGPHLAEENVSSFLPTKQYLSKRGSGETCREGEAARNLANKVQERHWRSIAKTISWRITATLTTLIISYLITGSLALAGLIGGIEFFSKIFLYYIHERTWNRIRLGIEVEQRPPDYQI